MTKKSVLLFGVLVLIVLVASSIRSGFFGGAFAQTPEQINLPLILKVWQELQALGGQGVLYVFPSNMTTNGDAGGRTGMAGICEATDPESHFCMLAEIERAFVDTGVTFSSFASEIWVDNAQLGTIYNNYSGSRDSNWYAESCSGWTHSGGYGITILNHGSDEGTEICASSLPVACCKRSP